MSDKVVIVIVFIFALVLIGFTSFLIRKHNDERHAYYVVCTAKGGTVIETDRDWYCIADKSIIRIGEVK